MAIEEDPFININLGEGRRHRLDRNTATLYTFAGHTALGDLVFDNTNLNHIFVQTSPVDDGFEQTMSGLYIFKAFRPQYKELAFYMRTHEFPMALNIRRVPECDLRAYFNQAEEQADRFATEIPDFPDELTD